MKRFISAWLISTISMLAVSYTWHGVILNDLRQVNYPEWYFFLLLCLTYSIIALIMTGVYQFTLPKKNPVFRAAVLGGAFGFFLYLVAFTLGISFKSGAVEHVVVDFVWQMVEQGFGAVVVAWVFAFATRLQENFG